MQIQSKRFEQIVPQAFAAVSDSRRWQNALVRAKHIAESNPFVTLQEDGKLIALTDSVMGVPSKVPTDEIRRPEIVAITR
jgi:hypothetical protein